jgi:hypothetical protein
LHDYTGIPAAYLEKANLRLNVGMFDQQVLGDTITGRLDTRYTGPVMDPVGREATYDPMIASIAAPYVALFNDYVRRELHFGEGRTYKYMGGLPSWDSQHSPPGVGEKLVADGERDAGPRGRDEAESESESADARRLLRPRHTVFQREVRVEPSADSRCLGG